MTYRFFSSVRLCHCIVLHCIALYCIVMYYIALHYIVFLALFWCCDSDFIKRDASLFFNIFGDFFLFNFYIFFCFLCDFPSREYPWGTPGRVFQLGGCQIEFLSILDSSWDPSWGPSWVQLRAIAASWSILVTLGAAPRWSETIFFPIP